MPRSDYEAHKEGAAERQRKISAKGRDIGAIPPVEDPKRRAKCERNFKLFCETYLRETFALKWSDDHLKAIKAIESATLEGLLFALAMPRGSGKTALLVAAVIWAILYGHHPMVLLVTANRSMAKKVLRDTKTPFESNDLLLADFPEACVPIRALKGIANKANGQTCEGAATYIVWGRDELVFPTIPGSRSSGSAIYIGAIKTAVRGSRITRRDGSTIRPSLVLINDPQTRDSARSSAQNDDRERIVSADVLGCAGPGTRISALMACTVICRGDLSDRMLDRTTHPDWQGQRCKALYSLPTRLDLWAELRDLEEDLLRRGAEPKTIRARANEFYREKRKAMDAGAEVAWPAKITDGDLSALQGLMAFRARDPEGFASEFQNEPTDNSAADGELLPIDDLVRKQHAAPRRSIPIGCDHLTAFIDVQGELLFWAVAAWAPGLTGYVVDYGAWPEQSGHEWTLRTASPTISQVTKHKRLSAKLSAAFETLLPQLLDRRFSRVDGIEVSIDRCLIDAGWGQSTDTIYEICRHAKYGPRLRASQGKGFRPSETPMAEWKAVPGEQAGHHWFVRTRQHRRGRLTLIDTNYWKSLIHEGLSTAVGAPGSISLWEAPAWHHRQFCEHLLAERKTSMIKDGRNVDFWELLPHRPDNHWFDCLVGCAVAASMLGCSLSGEAAIRRGRPKLEVSF